MYEANLASPFVAEFPVVVNAPEQTDVTPEFKSRWVDNAELRSLEPAWNRLADSPLWRNVALEPNYLIPALEHLGNDSVRLLVVENVAAAPEKNLVAVVPIETKSVFRLPFKTAEVWKHDQCFDATPLLCKTHGVAAWAKICEALLESQYAILSLDTVVAEPQFDSVLKTVEQQRNILRFQRDHFQRAAFVAEPSSELYLQNNVSKSLQKKLRRLLRRLSGQGEVTWESTDENSDFQQLAEDFMAIEASGWKGESGTALGCADDTRAFYRSLISESAAAGKVRFLSLMLDGRRIAMISDIRSGDYVCSYKTAYDDQFSAYSPGTQVEAKNLDYLHRDGVKTGDSCTANSSSSINRIWGQRLAFQNAILSLRPGIARQAVQMLPLTQRVVRRLRTVLKKG